MPDFDAGKYAAFVWPAYGLTALVFVILVVSALGHSRHWRRRAEALVDK
ncbi:MAG TPA: heme exporter protein CcmD [Phenylobacterium sp.]|nr:heme exporter protein CcmD [Phenylobacterium sp.]